MSSAELAALLTAFATLLTSLTALIKVLQMHGTVSSNANVLERVEAATNGTLLELQKTQATSEELAARSP